MTASKPVIDDRCMLVAAPLELMRWLPTFGWGRSSRTGSTTSGCKSTCGYTESKFDGIKWDPELYTLLRATMSGVVIKVLDRQCRTLIYFH